MLLLHGLNGIMDQLVGHHHLDFPLCYLLDLPRLTEKWLTAFQSAELALPQGLPTTLIIMTNTSATGAEYRVFHGIQVSFRHIKAQLVHRSLRRQD